MAELIAELIAEAHYLREFHGKPREWWGSGLTIGEAPTDVDHRRVVSLVLEQRPLCPVYVGNWQPDPPTHEPILIEKSTVEYSEQGPGFRVFTDSILDGIIAACQLARKKYPPQ